MSSRKRPCNQLIECGRLRELLAKRLAYCMLLTSRRTISGYVMCNFKFDRVVNGFVQLLTNRSLTTSYKQRKRPAGNSPT